MRLQPHFSGSYMHFRSGLVGQCHSTITNYTDVIVVTTVLKNGNTNIIIQQEKLL